MVVGGVLQELLDASYTAGALHTGATGATGMTVIGAQKVPSHLVAGPQLGGVVGAGGVTQ